MVFYGLADRYGWTLEEIAELTYPQIAGHMRYIEAVPAPYTVLVSLPE